MAPSLSLHWARAEQSAGLLVTLGHLSADPREKVRPREDGGPGMRDERRGRGEQRMNTGRRSYCP